MFQLPARYCFEMLPIANSLLSVIVADSSIHTHSAPITYCRSTVAAGLKTSEQFSIKLLTMYRRTKVD